MKFMLEVQLTRIFITCKLKPFTNTSEIFGRCVFPLDWHQNMSNISITIFTQKYFTHIFHIWIVNFNFLISFSLFTSSWCNIPWKLLCKSCIWSLHKQPLFCPAKLFAVFDKWKYETEVNNIWEFLKKMQKHRLIMQSVWINVWLKFVI